MVSMECDVVSTDELEYVEMFEGTNKNEPRSKLC